jgi:hypothetical protein
VRDRLTLPGVATLLAVLILAPLAASGYVLSYDMNFVPAQALRWDLIAPVDTLPRAVPLDGFVAASNLILPGWLLQRVILLAIVYLAALGAGRAVPTERSSIRVIAAVGYAWTPFVAERLLIGQWGLLVAYAAFPWLVRAAVGVRTGQRGALARLAVAAILTALTPTGALIALVTVAVIVPGRTAGVRGSSAAIGLAGLANLPWVVATATSAAGAGSDAAGVDAFAARGENWAGPLVSLLGTGGIWNADTTPASRTVGLIPLVTLGLVAVALIGARPLVQRWPAGVGQRMIGLAGASLVVAAWATLPGGAASLRWLVGHVPGAGLLRDGQKFALPYAFVLAVCVACGAERLAARVRPETGNAVLAGLMVLPVIALPDLAYGEAGALRPVAYPPDWAAVRTAVAARPGTVLSLPLAPYRTYPWNRDRVVLDPAPRYLPVPVLIDDTLYVGGDAVGGEDRRMAAIRAQLAAGAPVAATGVAWVLVQHRPGEQAVPAAALSGLTLAYAGDYLTLYENPTGTEPARDATAGQMAAAAVDIAVLLVLAGAVMLLVFRRIRRQDRLSGPAQTG